jgi:hypothetical protein
MTCLLRRARRFARSEVRTRSEHAAKDRRQKGLKTGGRQRNEDERGCSAPSLCCVPQPLPPTALSPAPELPHDTCTTSATRRSPSALPSVLPHGDRITQQTSPKYFLAVLRPQEVGGIALSRETALLSSPPEECAMSGGSSKRYPSPQTPQHPNPPPPRQCFLEDTYLCYRRLNLCRRRYQALSLERTFTSCKHDNYPPEGKQMDPAICHVKLLK